MRWMKGRDISTYLPLWLTESLFERSLRTSHQVSGFGAVVALSAILGGLAAEIDCIDMLPPHSPARR